MTTPQSEDPKLNDKVLRFYRRHERAARWAKRLSASIRVAVWLLGLGVTMMLISTGYMVYQDHGRIAELYRQGPSKAVELAVPPEALAAARPAQPPPDPLLRYRDGTDTTWQREAQQHINDALAHAISSANPPQHRHNQ